MTTQPPRQNGDRMQPGSDGHTAWIEACTRYLAGEATPAERADVEARMTADASGERAIFDEVQQLFGAVTALADDPSSLGDRPAMWPGVVARIQAEAGEVSAEDAGLLAAIRRWSDETESGRQAMSRDKDASIEAEAVGQLFAAVDRMPAPRPSRDLFPGVLQRIGEAPVSATAPPAAPRGRLLQLQPFLLAAATIAVVVGMAAVIALNGPVFTGTNTDSVASDGDGDTGSDEVASDGDEPTPGLIDVNPGGSLIGTADGPGEPIETMVEAGPAVQFDPPAIQRESGIVGPPVPTGQPIVRIDNQPNGFVPFTLIGTDNGTATDDGAKPDEDLPYVRTIRFSPRLIRDLPFEYVEPNRHPVLGPAVTQAELLLPTVDGNLLLRRGSSKGVLLVSAVQGSSTAMIVRFDDIKVFILQMPASPGAEAGDDADMVEIPYAVRFTYEAVSDQWYATPATTMLADEPVNGRRPMLVDGNLDGRFDTLAVDRITDSRDMTLIRMTPIQRIGDALYRVRPQRAGLEVVFTPYSGETGPITIETRYHKGVVVERVVLRALDAGGTEILLDTYDLNRTIQLPLGRWQLIEGRLRTGDQRLIIISPVDPALREAFRAWPARPLPQTAPEFRVHPTSHFLSDTATSGELETTVRGTVFVLGSQPRLVPLTDRETPSARDPLRLRVVLVGVAGESYAPVDGEDAGPVIPDWAFIVGDIQPDQTVPVLARGTVRRTYESDLPVFVRFENPPTGPRPHYLRLEERLISKTVFGQASICNVPTE